MSAGVRQRGLLCFCFVCSPSRRRTAPPPGVGVRWGSQTFWYQNPFTLLKFIKDPSGGSLVA